jgi:preprotein translocase subunit SecY
VGLTAGTLFIMWLGEQISEHGVGNGISLIIMAGIISNLYPSMASYLEGFDRGAWQTLLTFLGAWAIAVVAVVYMTKAQRRIPIQNAKHQRGRNVYGGERAFLPFKLNQANVMPIIFASALLIIPQFLGTATGITWLEQAFSSQTSGFWYVLTYTALIFFFAFFWTSMMFQPNEIAKNLQEQGSFVPGIRPGRQTAEFLESTMFRITLAGASFLAVVAIIPSFVGASGGGAMDMALLYFMSGTSILIVVGVALDMVEKLNAMLVMRNYETTMKEGEASAASGSGWGRRSS